MRYYIKDEKDTRVLLVSGYTLCLQGGGMSALGRLQEKIQELKEQYEALQQENAQLKAQIQHLSSSHGTQQASIAELRQELQDKDKEVEAIIAKVEALLS
jgi:chromosome segregation ATPase